MFQVIGNIFLIMNKNYNLCLVKYPMGIMIENTTKYDLHIVWRLNNECIKSVRKI